MKKLKLNIQLFASTNKTTHYELSQYIGTDKPTYLVDYNSDMSAIDTGIYNAQSKANTNENAIGNLSNLETSVKTDLVSAINEEKGKTDYIGNLSNLTTTANTDLVSAINEVDSQSNTNTSAIGTIANLETTNKTNLVGAVNEVNTKATTAESNIEKFNMTQFTTPTAPTTTTHTITRFSVNCASNSDGSIGKVYGEIRANISGTTSETITFSTPFRPSSQITIKGGIVGIVSNVLVTRDYTVDTNGDLSFYINGTNEEESRYILINSLVFFEDFGDTPTPNE